MNQHSVKKVKSTNLREGKTRCSVEMWICANEEMGKLNVE
jgi:hypothetical protein